VSSLRTNCHVHGEPSLDMTLQVTVSSTSTVVALRDRDIAAWALVDKARTIIKTNDILIFSPFSKG
jgi:hypothetical protein